MSASFCVALPPLSRGGVSLLHLDFFVTYFGGSVEPYFFAMSGRKGYLVALCG